jgi:hypothetical protein
MDRNKGFFRWVAGRQNEGEPGYFKMLFAHANWPKALSRVFNPAGGFDCYLLKYEPHYSLKPHRDPVGEDLKHYRLNIVFNGKGSFDSEKTIVNLGGRVILFRPDISTHSVQNGDSTRYVLSIGASV